MTEPATVSWPGGRSFAFSIFDDTDGATVDRVRPVYRLLDELGVRITKSMWPLPAPPGSRAFAHTLSDREGHDFAVELREKGFEIGYHGARDGSSERSVVAEALDLFRATVGHDPRTASHHAIALENVYWGGKRARDPLARLACRLGSEQQAFFGDDAGSAYFWGDLCRERIRYVRNFGFDGFAGGNLFDRDGHTPYHDPEKPWVHAWYSVSGALEAADVPRLVNPERVAEWSRRGALVLFTTHLAMGFAADGRVRPEFEDAMRQLAESGAWLAPVGEILDHLVCERGLHHLSPPEARRLERRWILDMGRYKLRSRLTRRRRRAAHLSGVRGRPGAAAG